MGGVMPFPNIFSMIKAPGMQKYPDLNHQYIPTSSLYQSI
jgi:hypothetical protein